MKKGETENQNTNNVEQDIIGLVISALPEMTAMQRKAADFIIKHPIDVAFMTLDQFAGRIGSSTTTIMRLMYGLNFKGYSEFQKSLQNQLRNKVNPKTRLETNLKSIDREGLYLQCYNKQVQNIQESFELTSEETFTEVLTAVVSSRRRYFAAVRGGIMIARYMYDFLGRMLGNCQLIHADLVTEWCNILPDLSEEDLIVAISFPRYARHITQLLSHAYQSGAKIVLFTDSYSSPMARYANIVLPCNCSSLGFHNSPIAAMMMADCVINAVALKMSDQVRSRLQMAEQIMAEDNYYMS